MSVILSDERSEESKDPYWPPAFPDLLVCSADNQRSCSYRGPSTRSARSGWQTEKQV